MEGKQFSHTIVALYQSLAGAEATLHALEAAGVPYPDIRMGTHTPEDVDRADIIERTALAGINAPERFWSLGVVQDPKWADKAGEVLRASQPLALGRLAAPDSGRGDADQGAIAWRHYVFSSPAASDQVGESAGTTGTTGLASSGVFASGALAEGNKPAESVPISGEADKSARDQPTSDTLKPKTSADRSRPETELHD